MQKRSRTVRSRQTIGNKLVINDTLPSKSEALKAVIKMTGIHDSNLQDIISDTIPG